MNLPNGEKIILDFCPLCHSFIEKNAHSEIQCKKMIKKRASLNAKELSGHHSLGKENTLQRTNPLTEPSTSMNDLTKKASDPTNMALSFDFTQSIQTLTTKISYLANLKKLFSINTPLTIAIEGNIGAGKTTFLKHLEKIDQMKICTLREPLEKWKNLNGINLLEQVYNDPQKWAHAFQSFVTLTMTKNHLFKSPNPIKILERSIFSTRYCFIEAHRTKNNIDNTSSLILDEWFKFIISNILPQLNLIIYIQTTPEISYERIHTRNRHEEKNITMEYVNLIHLLHENWLINRNFPLPCTLIVLNGNQSPIQMIEELNEKILKYKKFKKFF